MPDYSKCQIYKITCNDPSITECYIGFTTNFKERMKSHKTAVRHSSKLKYAFINIWGGWNNWTMKVIEDYPCRTLQEAEARETYYINIYKPSLNTSKCAYTKK